MPRMTTIPPELIGRIAILNRKGFTVAEIAKAIERTSPWVRSVMARYHIGKK